MLFGGARDVGFVGQDVGELGGHAPALAQLDQALEYEGRGLQLTYQREPHLLLVPCQARWVDTIEIPLRQLPVLTQSHDLSSQQGAGTQGGAREQRDQLGSESGPYP